MTQVLASDALVATGRCGPGWVAVEDGRVVDLGVGTAPPGARHLGPRVLSPGLVDLQLNGHGPIDVAHAAGEDWDRLAVALRPTGVTSFLPTLCSAPLDLYPAALDRIEAARRLLAAPRIEGVHLEGPFLGGAPGAHPTDLLAPVDLDWLDAALAGHPDLIRLVTLAPEADPDHAGTRLLVDRGVVVALGHSTCTFEAAIGAARAGARLVTHLGNGMRPLHQRDPGLLGAALADAGLTPTVIADGVHLHDAFLGIVLSQRPDAILVTDAVATSGTVFGAPVEARDGAAWLTDGTLTGSTLTLDAAVRRVIAVGAEPAHALCMASEHPARALDLDTWAARGVGGRADLVVWDPDSMRPVEVWVDGEPCWTGSNA